MADKKYFQISNGKIFESDDTPEAIGLFQAKIKELNLTAEEIDYQPGKFLGAFPPPPNKDETTQSQKNQEDTDLESEDTSSDSQLTEIPSWYNPDLVSQVNKKRYDTQGNVVESQKNVFGDYDVLTSDEIKRNQELERKRLKQIEQNELANNINIKNDGVFDFLVSKDIKKSKSRQADFFNNKANDAIAQFENVYGSDEESPFIYERVADKRNLDKVLITDKKTGDNIELDFNLASKSGLIKEDMLSSMRDNSFTNLFNFLNKNLTNEDKVKVKERQGTLINNREKLPIDLSKFETDKIKNNINNNENIFEPVVTTTTRGKDETEIIKKVTQPYEEELKEAEQLLKNQGFENPTKQEIEDEARLLIIQNDIEAEQSKKLSKFMNTIEETPLYNEVKIGSLLKQEKDIKDLAAYELQYKSKMNDISDSDEAKIVNEMGRFFNDPSAKFEIPAGTETIELDDGRLVPVDYFRNYKLAHGILDKKIQNFEDWSDDNQYKIDNLQSSEYKNNLIQRNYNDFDKFVFNIGSGAARIITKSGYGANKLGYALVGVDNKTLDKTMLDIEKANSIYRNNFQEDVKFEDAFTEGNFGKFLAQEIGNQIPIFATIAIPGIGIPSLGFSSAGDNWLEMVKKDAEKPGDPSSLFKKVLTSAGYGTAEVIFDRYLTLPVMKRSFKGMYGGGSKAMQTGIAGLKEQFVKTGRRQLLIDPILETSSEGLTTISQNILTGAPITENLGHALFSGGMFGTMFGHVPFYKGAMMNYFSRPEIKKDYNQNLDKITELKKQLDGTNKYIKPSTAKILNEQIQDLETKNNKILEDVEKQMENMSPKFVEQFLGAVSKNASISNQAKKITNDNTLDNKTKQQALANLQEQFNNNQAIINTLKDPKAFGNKFNGFINSKDQVDIQRREDIFQKAYNQLTLEGRTPNDKQINDAARIIYNTQEIRKDYKEKRGRTKLGKSLKQYQTVEDAVNAINKMDISDSDKQKLIDGVNNGNHGANVLLNNGERLPFQVVENMAKDDRLETRTHELGHTILEDAFKKNPGAFSAIAGQILQHVKNKNPNLHTLLLAETRGMTSDEIITRYMEMVVEGKIDFNKNKGLGGLMGYLFSGGVARATNSDFAFNFEGETDAVAFITNLAKKINAGTVTLQDIAAIKRSPVRKKKYIIDNYFNGNETKFSQALKDKTIKIVEENRRLYRLISKKSEEENIDLKEAVTQRIKDQLVVNNMATANKLARDAYEKGTRVVSLDKAVPLEDFQQEFLFELITLANTWNPKIVPEFGAYVNSNLPLRYGQILRKLKGESVEAVSISTKEGDIDIADTDIVSSGAAGSVQAEGKIVNKELGIKDSLVSEIENTVRDANVPLKGLTYKGVKKLITNGPLNRVLDIISKDLGIDANRIRKNQDLDSKQRQAFRDRIKEVSKKTKLADLLPDGTDRSGKATGVAPSLLNKFYIKGARAKVREGATAAGLPIQVKKPNITNETFLSEFGINPDGTSKKGTSLDGAIRAFVTQIAQLEANQQIRKNAIEQGVDRATVQKIGEGRSEAMFSEKVDAIINVRDSFELEAKGVDKLLSSVYKLSKTFNLRDEKGREAFVKAIEKDLLPIMPRDFWFGDDSTVFTASNKTYGLSMSVYKDGDVIPRGKKIGDFKNPEQSAAYIDLRKKIKALKNKEGVKFGKDVKDQNGNIIDFKVSSYTTLFETPAKIKANRANGNIDKFNKKVSIIHKEMWKRFNKAIRDDKSKAPIIGTYLKLVGSDTKHWHKLGAQFVGYSNKITGTRFEYEHAMPATAAYLYLLDASLSGSNFEASYNFVIDNYKLIALDKAMDKKLTAAKLQKLMPKNWSVIDGNWWQRYFNNDVVNVDGVGIDPNSIIGLDGKTFSQTLGINSSGDPAVIKTSRKTISKINNAVEAFNKQAKFIKEQNKAIQADLEKSGYTFINKRGMSTFDFDETVGVSENFVIAKKGNDVQRIASNEWPFVGEQLAKDGYEFDFTDFNKVTKGRPGPLFEKMKNQIAKYGADNVFILTARAPESEQAIHDWLDSNGINIPRENVTGLGNSTGEAKADWMLGKFAEGYNDMYFVDDAITNVKAVKEVLDQLDIKSKVVQAKIKNSEKISVDFNKILEESKGVYAGKKFSAQEARAEGLRKGRLRFFIPPSAEDFKGLLYSFLGKGRQGDAHAAWFKENLLDPFAKGIREYNTYKQSLSDDYQVLKKKYKNIGKMLNKKVAGTVFTNDNAIRVYLWNKSGFDVPGISEQQLNKLVDHVSNNKELKEFADSLSVISRVPEGYIEPEGYWVTQSIASDLSNIVLKVGRKDFLAEWINNKNIIFSEENLNKIEAIYGEGFRDALENVLHRMETGSNRQTGSNKQVNMLMDWINGSVAATMFFNIRSATLQTISSVNFINMSDNNIFKAAAAFANQPQYLKDFVFLFNSPMLKQRRAGLQIDVSVSEITRAFNQGKSKPEAILAYLLEIGFTPTQIADSFAISAGGATFYRNRLNTYLKKGMSEPKAREQAFLDFQEIAEETQQSSRPDLISMQQAGPLGRIILAWQNTPMQMTRLTKKALSDLINRRRTPGYNQLQSDIGNISSIMYYGLMQNLLFGALQTGLMFTLFGWDPEEEKKRTMEIRVANGALDTILRGTGIYGAAISTLKNVLLKWKEEREAPAWKRENLNIAQAAVDLSPPIGSKMRKIMQAVRTEEYNKGVSKEIGFRIENPNLSIAANWTEALTNIPVARVLNKANNVEEALTGNHETWQRIALSSGWNKWNVGVEDEELKAAKDTVKEKKEAEKKRKREQKKQDKKRKQPKKFRCRKTKSDYTRCKNMTTHPTQYCYAHR